ncbi:MAG: hypothetical protein LBB38_02435, partial [Puniceicoccales bacterium]|nr:hypothetical protein [Puniceicoccales bacterium]
MADKVDGPRRPALGLGRFGKFLAGSDITTSAYAKLAAENYARSCDDVLKLIDGPVRFSSTIPGIILKIALYVISAGILLFVYLWAINSDAFRVTVESCCKVVSQKLRKGSGTPKMQAPPGASDELHDDDMPLPRTGAHWDSGEEIHSPQPSGAQSSGAGTASTSASWAPNSGSGPSVPSPQPSGAGTASPPPPPAPSPGQSVPPTRPEGISDKWHRFFSTATSINVLDFWRGDIGVIIGRCDGTEPKIEYISHANLNNFYPNVKEIILECVKFKSDADFSGCEKIETVTVKDGVITGSLILGPRVRKLTVERLKVGGSIDLSKCCDLTDLTFECDGVLGSCYNGGLIFSPDLTTRVCLSGTWFDGRKYIDAIISKCKSAPNVKVINEASIRPSSIGELEHGALCRTTSVEVISRFNVSGAFSVEVVVGDCKVFLYDDDFSCYRDIEKIVIKSTLNNCADFSRLAYIKEVACIGARVKDVLVLGENVETFIAESSCFERGVDFSRCSKLSELRLVGCKDTGSRLGCGIEMSIFPPGCRAKVHLTGTWPKRAYLDSVRKLFGDRFPETFTCDATAKDDGIHDMLRCARAVHIDYRGSVGEIKLECWDSDANCIGSAEVAVDDIEILEPYGGIRSVVISGFRQSIDLSPFHFTEVACRDAYISGDVIFCESVERVCVECP